MLVSELTVTVTGSVASVVTPAGTEITAVQWVALEQVTPVNAVP